ncbi:alpha/beta fold hydrolase [Streptomyces roseicoloratus]|uniref:alpha/beta fold hydrolase n=1 Tax=Streptomyces roseicoloratus TaxID=2508722 RepID=UPI001009F619|nr:alpha/beta hydrolase [Streptomyces roseicoloratus]
MASAPHTSATFTAPDGTRLAHRLAGSGDPLLCVPGGPADSAYLGDLGGLATHRTLVLPDLRGTGRSPRPADPAGYRCDRLVDDIEALRAHLGLERVDLLGHSAGANIAAQYAARYPHRVARLALVTPGLRAVGVDITGDARLGLARRRAHEPWFPAAFAALRAINSGNGGTDADWEAVAPFRYGRWDEAARRHEVASRPDNPEAVAGFGAGGAFGPDRIHATRAALATLPAPVLLLAGEFDLNSPPGAVAELAGLVSHAVLRVQPGAGHYPWLDDPAAFVASVTAFLDGASR